MGCVKGSINEFESIAANGQNSLISHFVLNMMHTFLSGSQTRKQQKMIWILFITFQEDHTKEYTG